MAYHAKLSPSSAARWSRCPGSVAVHKDRGGSRDADIGTMAHEVRALCLRNGTDPQAYVGRLFNVAGEDEPARELEWTGTLADELRPDVDRVRLFAAARHSTWLEVKVPIDHITREGGATGTSDLIVLELGEKTVLYVDDLKFGKGVKVDVQHNEQAILYALGAVRHLSDLDIVPDEVVLSISQPRIDGHSEWRITLAELNAFGEKLHGAAVRTTLKDAPRLPGPKQCRWCSFKAECPEALDYAQKAAQADFTNEESKGAALHDVVKADAKRVADMMLAADFLEQLIRAYRARCEAMLFGGVKVPGWKLVQGREGARAWSAEAVKIEEIAAAANVPREKLYAPPPLRSPTDLERTLGKKAMPAFAEVIKRSPGSVSVAPEGDPRPAHSPASTGQEFSNVEDV